MITRLRNAQGNIFFNIVFGIFQPITFYFSAQCCYKYVFLKITSEQPIFMNEFHGSTNQQIEGFSTDQSAINIYKSCFLNYKHAERVQVIVV